MYRDLAFSCSYGEIFQYIVLNIIWFQEDEEEEELKMETTRRVVTKAKTKKANKQAGVVKGVKMGATCADLGSPAPGCDVRGGGVDVKEGSRGIPVTLSMKTETVFTKLLGEGPPRPNNPGRAVELNLLSLQPVPINLLPSSFSPNHNQTLLLPPSPPSSLPSPPPPPRLHIGPNSNLAKQEGGECVGREGSASSYSLPPSPLDQDKMDEEEEENEEKMMDSMEEKMEMLSSLVPVFKDRDEEEDEEDMVPSVEQLFQRSFSYELRDLWGGGGELVVLEGLLDGDSKADLLVLEDIVSVIGGDAATKVVV